MKWKLLGQIADLKTPWIELVGERWRDDAGKTLEYWRVVAAHSVIAIPEHRGSYLLPLPQFRPGVDRATLDFPGGRLPEDAAPAEAALAILERELGVPAGGVMELVPINDRPLLVNSSASNQMLHGFHARLDPALDPAALKPHRAFEATGVAADLLADLDCLQCRALLLEMRAGR